MQTALYEIELTDGRVFRIFCANATQCRKALASFRVLGSNGKIATRTLITNGIHTNKQWQNIFATL